MNATLPPGSGSRRNVTRSNCFTSVPAITSSIFHASATGRPAAFADLASLAGSNTSAAKNCGGTYFTSTGVPAGVCAPAGDARVSIATTAVQLIFIAFPPAESPRFKARNLRSAAGDSFRVMLRISTLCEIPLNARFLGPLSRQDQAGEHDDQHDHHRQHEPHLPERRHRLEPLADVLLVVRSEEH